MKFILTALLSITLGTALADDRTIELSFLAPLVDQDLLPMSKIEIPALRNIEAITDGASEFLELRMFEHQANTNGGNRAEISVDFPFGEGDTVIYEWRMRIPEDSVADNPQNRWWVLAQWHDQPDRRTGESWDGFLSRSPPISLGYGVIDGQDVVALTYGAPEQKGIALTPLTRGVWHNMKAVIRWSTGNDGMAEVFMDNLYRPFAQAHGPNMMNSYQHYMKLGMYRDPDIQVFSRIQLDDLRIQIATD